MKLHITLKHFLAFFATNNSFIEGHQNVGEIRLSLAIRFEGRERTNSLHHPLQEYDTPGARNPNARVQA